MNEQPNKINDGGPAFPQPNHLVETDRGREEARGWMHDSGMSLRDYYAGLAMQALISICPDMSPAKELLERPQNLSAWAYIYADAMIIAREKTKP